MSVISSACSPVSGADQQVVDFDAELFRVHRIERMLGVDEGGCAAETLRRTR